MTAGWPCHSAVRLPHVNLFCFNILPALMCYNVHYHWSVVSAGCVQSLVTGDDNHFILDWCGSITLLVTCYVLDDCTVTWRCVICAVTWWCDHTLCGLHCTSALWHDSAWSALHKCTVTRQCVICTVTWRCVICTAQVCCDTTVCGLHCDGTLCGLQWTRWLICAEVVQLTFADQSTTHTLCYVIFSRPPSS